MTVGEMEDLLDGAIQNLPDPDTLRLMVVESQRRTDLLRGLLELSKKFFSPLTPEEEGLR